MDDGEIELWEENILPFPHAQSDSIGGTVTDQTGDVEDASTSITVRGFYGHKRRGTRCWVEEA